MAAGRCDALLGSSGGSERPAGSAPGLAGAVLIPKCRQRPVMAVASVVTWSAQSTASEMLPKPPRFRIARKTTSGDEGVLAGADEQEWLAVPGPGRPELGH